jgi:3-hydroxyacyl-CoA dehydrogenase
VGAGRKGSGIAQVAAQAGLPDIRFHDLTADFSVADLAVVCWFQRATSIVPN